MDDDPSTRLPPSIRGVVWCGISLVIAILAGSFFAYFGWKSLDADIAPFTVMTAGGCVLTVGDAWASVVGMRLRWRPSIPRAHEGVLDLRFPRQWRRGLRLCGIGGAIFTVGGLMGIWVILTDEPVTWFRAGATLFLVLMLLLLVAGFIGAFLSNRIRFVADGWGLRWYGPFPKISILLPWSDIAHLSRREGGMLRGPRVVAITKEGRTLAIPIPAVSLPVSREARAQLLTEVERLRPTHEPNRPPVDNQDVFERFNDEARRVMIVAQQITRAVGHEEIGTVELLVALGGDDYLSGRVLARLGVSPQAVSAAADQAVDPGSLGHLTHRPLANDAKKAILSTSKEADRLNETAIGTEHLLLGVLRERKSVGGKILKELGVTYDAARDAILEVRAADQPPPLPPPPLP
jgi:hypothetical protein